MQTFSHGETNGRNRGLGPVLAVVLAAGLAAVPAGAGFEPTGRGEPAAEPSGHQPETKPAQATDPRAQEEGPAVEIVFVLDTTGSMGGLIEGAKQKIWSIASAVAGAQPAPKVRMGLVGYRDRNDQYITTVTALSDDLDLVYTKLMAFDARGGGDAPESVNEALFRAVERTAWSEDEDVLRIVYLVGDAPPHMDYEDDVKYRATCALAAERGVIVNTIQCGNMGGTEAVWREIAQYAGGTYFRVEQSGGAVVYHTEYDEPIAQLNTELMETMLDYGTPGEQRKQAELRGRAESVEDAAPAPAKAARAAYNQTAAGARNLYGVRELIYDLDNGVVVFDEIEPEHLPERLRGKSRDEQLAIIDSMRARRAELSARIRDLAEKREADIRRQRAARSDTDGFDARMLEALRDQAERVGLTIPE